MNKQWREDEYRAVFRMASNFTIQIIVLRDTWDCRTAVKLKALPTLRLAEGNNELPILSGSDAPWQFLTNKKSRQCHYCESHFATSTSRRPRRDGQLVLSVDTVEEPKLTKKRRYCTKTMFKDYEPGLNVHRYILIFDTFGPHKFGGKHALGRRLLSEAYDFEQSELPSNA